MWLCQLQSQTSKTQQRQDSSRPPEVTRTERGGGGGRGVVWGAQGERKSDEKGCGQQKGGGRIADELETEGSLSSPARAREEDPGAGNGLDEWMIPVENSGCHRQHSCLIRESGPKPHYNTCWMRVSIESDAPSTSNLMRGACVPIVCGLSLSVNRAATASGLACHYPAKN